MPIGAVTNQAATQYYPAIANTSAQHTANTVANGKSFMVPQSTTGTQVNTGGTNTGATGTGASGTPTGTGTSTGTGTTTGATSGTSSTTSTSPSLTASSLGTDTFLKLLVAQLSNQDPMQPMDDSTFLTQLAQFNSVEQMNNVNTGINNLLSTTQESQGVNLLGQTIQYTTTDTQGNSTTAQGAVQGVQITGGTVQLTVNQQTIPMTSVVGVLPATQQSGTTSSPTATSATGTSTTGLP